MLNLSARIRSKDESVNQLRKKGKLPAVVYGYQTDNLAIKMDRVDFEKAQREAGESTLIKIDLKDEKGKKMKVTPTVLIQETQEHPVTDEFTHVDFYQPDLKEKVQVEIPLEFVGESLAVKEEDGTLVRNLSEVTIEALPESLIHDIEVDVSVLETFDDVIKVKDLDTPEEVEIMEDDDTVVALVSRPQDIDEELEEPIDEELEDIEVVGEKEEEPEEEDAEDAEEAPEKEEKPKKEEENK